MAAIEILAGMVLTATDLEDHFNHVQFKRQTADQVVTGSTALVSSNDLVFNAEPNKTYVFASMIAYLAGTASDFKFGISVPAGAVLEYSPFCNQIGDSSITAALSHDFITVNPIPLGGGDPNILTARPMGVIANGTTSGSIRVQFSQWVSAAFNTTLKKNSWMMLVEVD